VNPARPLTASLPPRRRTRATSSAPLLSVPAARLIAFAALASFGAVQWGRLVAPGAGGAMVAALLAAVVAGAVLTQVARARWPARARWAAGLLAALALLVVAFLAAGVPTRLLGPRGWDELARGIGDGLGAVPSITVPYRGAEEWTRDVIVLGGAALIGLAALLAFVARRDGRFGYPLASALALGALYATPIIQRSADRPFASGLAFALLLAAFLWLERIERRGWAPAAGLVAVAALAGLIVAPALDRDSALLDYEQLAQSLSPTITTTYTWNHTYGALDWPRDGREVLRVKAEQRSYWKAANLNVFDGRGWVEDNGPPGISRADVARLRRAWVQNISVTVRALRSEDFVAAGTTLAIFGDDGRRRGFGADGPSGGGLTRGETYRAAVYVPRPQARQLRVAGTDFPLELHGDYGFLRLPDTRPGLPRDRQIVSVPFWGAPADPQQPDLAGAVAGTPYEGVYALASRLRAQADTPYAYMRAVERHLTRGFSYSETPPPSRVPLADFLLRDKVGYCQQFSGAMALLMRLGGVPARVSAGFAPGALDDKTQEYIVRDIDAHSWVEVYFPGIGWVTRDPTPSASPARSQTADLATQQQDSDVTIGAGGASPIGGQANRGDAPTPAAAADQGGSSDATVAIVAGGVLALALAVLAFVLRRRRRRTAAEDAADELAELRRALRRSGRDPHPQLTLELLARRLAGTGAESYVRTLVAARYGYASGRPTRDERAALRRELAAGLGLRGRLRAWWALPPRAPVLRRSRLS
jgi:transglutaminase-like putative cysteine protease